MLLSPSMFKPKSVIFLLKKRVCVLNFYQFGLLIFI